MCFLSMGGRFPWRGWGNVELNLRDETIDTELFPKKKTKLWGNLSPVEISGTLNNPTVSRISSETLASEGDALVLAPLVYLPARGLRYFGGMLKNRRVKIAVAFINRINPMKLRLRLNNLRDLTNFLCQGSCRCDEGEYS